MTYRARADALMHGPQHRRPPRSYVGAAVVVAVWLAAAVCAARWLEALEAAYTMEEQRSGHHGNVHVQQSAGVEFF